MALSGEIRQNHDPGNLCGTGHVIFLFIITPTARNNIHFSFPGKKEILIFGAFSQFVPFLRLPHHFNPYISRNILLFLQSNNIIIVKIINFEAVRLNNS